MVVLWGQFHALESDSSTSSSDRVKELCNNCPGHEAFNINGKTCGAWACWIGRKWLGARRYLIEWAFPLGPSDRVCRPWSVFGSEYACHSNDLIFWILLCDDFPAFTALRDGSYRALPWSCLASRAFQRSAWWSPKSSSV